MLFTEYLPLHANVVKPGVTDEGVNVREVTFLGERAQLVDGVAGLARAFHRQEACSFHFVTIHFGQ